MKKILLSLILVAGLAVASPDNNENDELFKGDSWEMTINDEGQLYEVLGTKIYGSYFDCWVAMNQMIEWAKHDFAYECHKSDDLDYME